MTELQEFDPYSQRLARDVRNALGHWFVHGLLGGQADPAGYALAHLKQNDLPSGHRQWVRRKIDEYRHFILGFDGKTGAGAPLELGLDLWRAGLFFEAHEAIEQEWQNATGDRRLALKALVQAVGSRIHAKRGAHGPAVSLAAKAARGVEQYGHSLVEIPWLPSLARQLRESGPVEISNFAWSRPDDRPRPPST